MPLASAQIKVGLSNHGLVHTGESKAAVQFPRVTLFWQAAYLSVCCVGSLHASVLVLEQHAMAALDTFLVWWIGDFAA